MRRLWVPNRFDGFYTDVSSVNTDTVYELFAKVGTSSSPTSNGIKSITGIGFNPKLVMPFSFLGGAGYTGGASFALNSFGASDGTNNSSVWICSHPSLTTSNTSKRHDNMKCISAGNPVPLEASISSFNNDGFDFNYSTAYTPSALSINHIVLGGNTFEAKVTQHQMNSTGFTQSFAHGLSTRPSALLIFMTPHISTTAQTTNELQLSIGAYANNNQWATALYSRHGVTTTTTRRSLYTDRIAIDLDIVSPQKCMVIDSVDSKYINVSYLNSSNEQWIFYLVAITGCKAKTGIFDCNGSLNPLTITCDGIIPKLFLPIFIPSGTTLLNSNISTLSLSIGASDGTNNVSCGVYDADGALTTNARRHQSSTSLSQYDSSSNLVFEATAIFDKESVILDPTTIAAVGWGQGAYIILGV